jgi:hypothetical protein
MDPEILSLMLMARSRLLEYSRKFGVNNAPSARCRSAELGGIVFVVKS